MNFIRDDNDDLINLAFVQRIKVSSRPTQAVFLDTAGRTLGEIYGARAEMLEGVFAPTVPAAPDEIAMVLWATEAEDAPVDSRPTEVLVEERRVLAWHLLWWCASPVLSEPVSSPSDVVFIRDCGGWRRADCCDAFPKTLEAQKAAVLLEAQETWDRQHAAKKEVAA